MSQTATEQRKTEQAITELSRINVQADVPSIPQIQTQLLLHKAKEPYEIHNEGAVPKLRPGELLVQVQAIGLNPIDWKSAEYGFGLPSLPCVNGREFVGQVLQEHSTHRADINVGDTILAVSTDYRDFRTSAFQQFAVINDFNAIKLSTGFDHPRAAAVGVAFVAAAIGLGICLGLKFPRLNEPRPLDLLEIARSQDDDDVPEDVFVEVCNPISPWNCPHTGDWILVYGASSVTAQIAIQLAKWAGLKVVAIADASKHGSRLQSLGADKIIDRHDLSKAAETIRTEIPVPLRFALDTVGSESASWCQDILASRTGVQYRPSLLQTGSNNVQSLNGSTLAHLVCLTGSPKVKNPNVRIHKVPVKLFHTNQGVGRAVSDWLADLLRSEELQLPETVFENGGLEVIGPSLERLKSGELSGKRLVVRLK